ncbi:PREDICTED: uncharacterized protein LOC108615676 [Drosophila arizonae]|uniref:Uncharacterized protein LOC108615676 n=1 Tax=Drosophila arizonae TaxID=7263 RepID=A0ABM1PF44_DROAR|nr:PREDICTED: uncharacterized protein LOC108615676 [Drosophila arizonae]
MGGKGKSCECTLETKVLFFCIWIIVTGFFAAISIGSLIPIVMKNRPEHLGFFVTLVVLAVIEMVAGSCMTIAFYKKIAWLFMVGLVFSSFYPYCAFIFLVPLVMHIVFTVYACQYFFKMLSER